MTIKKQNQSIYFFGDGKADGNTGMRDLLGGKGAGLAEMSNPGVPVPPGITISTEVCNEFIQNNFISSSTRVDNHTCMCSKVLRLKSPSAHPQGALACVVG